MQNTLPDTPSFLQHCFSVTGEESTFFIVKWLLFHEHERYIILQMIYHTRGFCEPPLHFASSDRLPVPPDSHADFA